MSLRVTLTSSAHRILVGSTFDDARNIVHGQVVLLKTPLLIDGLRLVCLPMLIAVHHAPNVQVGVVP